ncbi:MAG: hypothetical protein WAU69_05750 [Solirubrobacteraceae bacterium]
MTGATQTVVFTAQSKRSFYCREAVSEFVFSRGAIPVNPFLVFGFFLGDRVERDVIRAANNVLVMRCDELWVFGRDLANGVLQEISLAANAGKPIRFFSVEDRPELIQELHVDALRFENEVRNKTGHPRQRLLEDLRQVLPSSLVGGAMSLDL